jgi:sulfite reductase (NADPH) hemoprotein beta-component
MPFDAIAPIFNGTAPEPLARSADVDEFRDALAAYRAGDWDDEKFTAFRLRFGVYGQRQPGVQMVRIKVPGGLLSAEWARKVAQVTRGYAKGDVHVTTRQDFQIYYVPLDDAPAMLADLDEAGLTTREACGNTVRNISSCALAGVCPREHVDAGKVADQLARSWIRNPLVQHMPRKFKISVSGCATDCGASSIHDLGLVATEKDGRKGFKVYGGGGLGGVPFSAIELTDFATEDELPAVLEALIRLHQRYSNRKNRNAARIKYLVKRFGADKFRALFAEAFARAKALPQRPWQPHEWRQPTDAPEPASPGGIVRQHNGRASVVANLPLGLLSADQLDGLADIAARHSLEGLRTTREQNIAILGIDAELVGDVVDAVRALGLAVEDAVGDVADVVSCPGTTSCRIGITNSQDFAREIVEDVTNYAPRPGLTVRLSGCQNSCGMHHSADFGFRGMGKKIDGRNAPHYQIYIGGNAREAGAIGLRGPIVPARHAKQALKLFLDGYAADKRGEETVRDWAIRLGKGGLAALLAPLETTLAAAGKEVYLDWGHSEWFEPPSIAHGECAAGFAVDNLYRDLADDALINLDRAIAAGSRSTAIASGRDGLAFASRRLLLRVALASDDEQGADDLAGQARDAYTDEGEVLYAIDAVTTLEAAARDGGDLDTYREALALLIDSVGEIAKRPLPYANLDLSKLGDFDPAALGQIGNLAAAE